MSIALNARIKELERRVAALEARPKVEVRADVNVAHTVEELIARLEAVENRPRPGRPRKEAQ